MLSPSMQKWPAHRNLWPTPEANDSSGGRVSKEMGGKRPSGAKRAIPLATAVAHAMWPTPTANNYECEPEVFLPRREREKAKGRNGNGFGLTLGMAARLWPTPSARDWKSSNASPDTMERNSRPLNETVTDGAGGSLNPTWVEWLMGFPPGWTDLEPWATP
jgi:hypothetical protein